MSSQGPEILHLMLTSKCSAKCVHCYEQPMIKAKKLRSGGLSFDDVQDLIDRFGAGLQAVNLSGYGEPLMHKRFDDILALVQQSQARYGWTSVNVGTSGVGLTAEQAALICSMPGQISVSFDAMDPEVFRAVRKGIDVFDVLQSIDLLLAQTRHQARQIGINMVVVKKNVAEMIPVAKWAAGAKLNYVSFSRGIWLGKRVQGISADDSEAFAAINRVRSEFPCLGVAAHFFAGATTSRWHPTRCAMPEHEFLVMHDGHVRPCCYAMDLDLGYWKNVEWNGPEFTELRERLSHPPIQAAELPTCADCPIVPPWKD